MIGEVALWLFFRGMLVGTEGRGKSRKNEVARMTIPTRKKFRRPRTSILRVVARRLRAYGEKIEMGPWPKNPEKNRRCISYYSGVGALLTPSG